MSQWSVSHKRPAEHWDLNITKMGLWEQFSQTHTDEVQGEHSITWAYCPAPPPLRSLASLWWGSLGLMENAHIRSHLPPGANDCSWSLSAMSGWSTVICDFGTEHSKSPHDIQRGSEPQRLLRQAGPPSYLASRASAHGALGSVQRGRLPSTPEARAQSRSYMTFPQAKDRM